MAMNAWPSWFANFVDGADVGMIERRCPPRFAAKTFQGNGILRCVLRQEL